MTGPFFRLAFALALLLAFSAGRAAAADRYLAWLADGQRTNPPRQSTWPLPGVALLTDANPLRLMRDAQAAVELKPPYLVLANGDVLTGSPIGLEPDLGRQQAVPRVKVRVDGLLPLSGTGVWVRTDRIARIVGTAEAALAAEPPPGTVELADGRRFVARSLKWRDAGLALLTPQGIIDVLLADIVDAVLPDIDRTAAVIDDALWAGVSSTAGSGKSAGTIVRFQLAGGATITASRITREQQRSRRRGRGGGEAAYYYYVQPAWADQPLALPEKEIVWCGYRAGDEVPLSLLPGEQFASRRLVGGGPARGGGGRPAGTLAASGPLETDLAIATHSHGELAIDLPPAARSLQLSVGLDRAVGSGGCVRCLIVAESAGGDVLWDSGILQGSDGPRPTGPIDVSEVKRVVLITEFAHDDRPAGADPLDIRDQVVWLAPLVKLDVELAQRLGTVLAGTDAWQLAGDAVTKAQLASRWSLGAKGWDPILALPRGVQLKLIRKLRVNHSSDVLELRTACPSALDEHEFLLTVNGRPAEPAANNVERAALVSWVKRYGSQRASEEDEDAAMSDRLAYWWDLQAWRGQEVTLELTLEGKHSRNEIAWRGFAIRSAVGNLPPSGEPLAFDVPLTSLAPIASRSLTKGGEPMKDALPIRPPEPIRFLGQRFTGGYGLQRDSAVSFPLQPDFRRFVAIAGCSRRVAGPLQVLIDDRVVWERPKLNCLTPAEQIDILIPRGAQRLTLQTAADDGSSGHAAWAQAGFVK